MTHHSCEMLDPPYDSVNGYEFADSFVFTNCDSLVRTIHGAKPQNRNGTELQQSADDLAARTSSPPFHIDSKKVLDVAIGLVYYLTSTPVGTSCGYVGAMFFSIDPNNGVAIYEQIVRQVKFAIADTTLRPGQLLPSVRVLSQQLAINPNTINRDFQVLQTDGILESLAVEA